MLGGIFEKNDIEGRSQAFNQKIITTRMFTHTGQRRGDVFAESSLY